MILDSNILISGIVWQGKEFQLMRAGLGKYYHAITCPFILEEVRRILPKNLNNEIIIDQKMELLSETFDVVEVHQEYMDLSSPFLTDQNDIPILALTLQTGAILVTVDKLLKKEAREVGARALRTSQALKLIAENL